MLTPEFRLSCWSRSFFGRPALAGPACPCSAPAGASRCEKDRLLRRRRRSARRCHGRCRPASTACLPPPSRRTSLCRAGGGHLVVAVGIGVAVDPLPHCTAHPPGLPRQRCDAPVLATRNTVPAQHSASSLPDSAATGRQRSGRLMGRLPPCANRIALLARSARRGVHLLLLSALLQLPPRPLLRSPPRGLVPRRARLHRCRPRRRAIAYSCSIA